MLRPLVLVSAFVVLASSCAATPPSCDSSSCATGCCDTSGVCRSGTAPIACGLGGAACVSCDAAQGCQLGACVTPGGTGGGTGSDAGPATAQCAGTLSACGASCVDTLADVQSCGGCGAGCRAGQVCNRGSCEAPPTDCVNAGGCAPGYSCDPSTRRCTPGCRVVSECPQGASCGATGCECPSGQHACGQRCVSNQSPASCGASCLACPAEGGTATCDGVSCGIDCGANALRCQGRCAACQTPPNATAVCAGASCDFTCFAGFHRCGTTCAADDSALACGAACTICPTTAHGQASCDGTCRLTCDSGYQQIGTECLGLPRWTLRTLAAPGPSARSGHAMAFDAARGRMVLFGGFSGTQVLGDTWEFDGTTWVARTVTGPSPRRGHVMIFDATRGVTLLLGGETASAVLSDLWSWNGTAWTQVTLSPAPAARRKAGFAWDAAGGGAVLYGGEASRSGQTSSPLSDTWLLSSTWTSQGGGPQLRGMVLSDHPGTGVFSFGGFVPAVWRYQSGWTQLFPSPTPYGRQGAMMALDQQRQRVVLFGGVYMSRERDTWEWDGTQWEEKTLTLTPSPSAREDAAMAWDSARNRMVLFGGASGPFGDYSAPLDDTWEYGP